MTLVKSACTKASSYAALRRCCLTYIPTVFVVSIFVALTWLGLAMEKGTFENHDLVVVIAYFAALCVVECVLLGNLALKQKRSDGGDVEGQKTNGIGMRIVPIEKATSARNSMVSSSGRGHGTGERRGALEYGRGVGGAVEDPRAGHWQHDKGNNNNIAHGGGFHHGGNVIAAPAAAVPAGQRTSTGSWFTMRNREV